MQLKINDGQVGGRRKKKKPSGRRMKRVKKVRNGSKQKRRSTLPTAKISISVEPESSPTGFPSAQAVSREMAKLKTLPIFEPWIQRDELNVDERDAFVYCWHSITL